MRTLFTRTTTHSKFNLKFLSVLAGMGMLFGASAIVHAGGTGTWDGGGANDNWSTDANWQGDTEPPSGYNLVFPSGASRLNNNNDVAGFGTPLLQFTGSSYVLNGNELEVSAIQANQASGPSTLNLDLLLGANTPLSVLNDAAFVTINGDIDTDGFDLTVTGNGNVTINNGSLIGSGNLILNSNALLTLNSNSPAYSGDVTANSGSLVLNNLSGSATGSGQITLNSSSELFGSGQTASPLVVNSGAQVRPGDNDPGVLTVGNVALQSGSVFAIQIDGPVLSTEYSQLEVTGTVNIDNAIFRIALGTSVAVGNSFIVLDNDGSDAVTGQFQGLPEGQTFRITGVDDIGFNITYEGGDGNDVVIQTIPTISIASATIAEPANGTTVMTFTVTLSEPAVDTVTVDFSTADGSAVSPEDYESADGTLTFGPGLTSQNISITINSETVTEQNESFTVNLFNPSNASIAVGQATGNITPPGSGGGGSSSGGCGLNPAAMPGSQGALVFFGFALAAAVGRRFRK